MARPDKLPFWNTGGANRTEPSDGKKSEGWTLNEIPPASWFNYWQNKVREWIQHLDGTLPMAGDGTDGDVTIAGTVTLTRDMYYLTLTVPNTAILDTAGFRVFASQSITVETGGIIRRNGNAASGVTGGSIHDATIASLAGGLNGGAGGSGAAAPGVAGASATNGLGGGGGKGGDITGLYSGGAAGSANAPAANKGGFRHQPWLGYLLCPNASSSLEFLRGGAGGGGGACNTAGQDGGGGGGGGGVVILCSPSITVAGQVQARGGVGADASGGEASGGGGGGGGLIIAVGRNIDTTAGLIDTTGGSGGDRSGTTSEDGVAGSTGTYIPFTV
jgi:hypothetical protein